jgi:hypothetical protein
MKYAIDMKDGQTLTYSEREARDIAASAMGEDAVRCHTIFEEGDDDASASAPVASPKGERTPKAPKAPPRPIDPRFGVVVGQALLVDSTGAPKGVKCQAFVPPALAERFAAFASEYETRTAAMIAVMEAGLDALASEREEAEAPKAARKRVRKASPKAPKGASKIEQALNAPALAS